MTEQSVNTRERESRIRGMVYGLALGDALGYPVEFENAPAVTGISGTLIISDDTQMSLHNVAALQKIVRAYGHKLRSLTNMCFSGLANIIIGHLATPA